MYIVFVHIFHHKSSAIHDSINISNVVSAKYRFFFANTDTDQYHFVDFDATLSRLTFWGKFTPRDKILMSLIKG